MGRYPRSSHCGRAHDLGLGGRGHVAADVDEVAHHDGHVVGGTGPQGEGDEPVGALARVLHRGQHLVDGLRAT